MQQILSKKNCYSLDIDIRNQKTGQLTGDSKIARLTIDENFALQIIEADEAMKEMFGCRADDNVARLQLYKQIATQGYCRLEDIETELKNKTTLNTIDIYLTGCGIMSDLVTDGLELQRTIDEKKRRKSTTERVNDRAEKK